jgi:arginine decarboxylase
MMHPMQIPLTPTLPDPGTASPTAPSTALAGNRDDDVGDRDEPAIAPDLSSYFNASHLRIDTWARLKRSAERLARDPEGPRADEHGRQVASALDLLAPIEPYWAFPGASLFDELRQLHEDGRFHDLASGTSRIVRLLVSGDYRRRQLDESGHELILGTNRLAKGGASPTRRNGALAVGSDRLSDPLSGRTSRSEEETPTETRPYFEVLVVDALGARQEQELRARLQELRADQDPFVYEVVVVPSFQDALAAVLLDYNIQACVYRYGFPFDSSQPIAVLQPWLDLLDPSEIEAARAAEEPGIGLARVVERLRPELDQFLVTDAPVEEVARRSHSTFRRIFYRQEDDRELHLSILKGISERYSTPFFDALRSYSQKPTGVFHAMPISRGKSIDKSRWIKDMGAFYGTNIFLAETSATSGGLDSLLEPHGPLERAQKRAARAYGARRTYFVTNGTSTANKIVVQALVRPGDIVLVDRACHKSHHYGIMLSGGQPVYMDSYPLSAQSMYGAVPLEDILGHLRRLKAAGKLDRVRMVLLTNCTFDGLTYAPQRVMHEILAIKPDMIFLWDEAWFGFATFHPTLRRRTAIDSARRLRERYASKAYRRRWEEAKAKGETEDETDGWVDPEAVRVRVYATQSTHKTLTALRQGSMIHVLDQDFEEKVYGAFSEAYMTHTSTSPNYQILASLDVGRRQVELEGYEMVQKAVELAMTLREKVRSMPELRRYFRVLGPAHLIPEGFRESGLERYYDPELGWQRMEKAWKQDEFALDPTRVTLDVGRTGMDGDTFRRLLMDRFDIQINKTSRNSVLFMVHIGTTRGAVAYLIEVLARIASELDEQLDEMKPIERQRYESRVRSLTEGDELPPLPDFSRFHPAFLEDPGSTTPEGDTRRAFFQAYDQEACEMLPLDGTIESELDRGRTVVSARFVTPYPPGFPILVPGQVISRAILDFLRALDVKEIHGYSEDYGLEVFTEEALAGSSSEALAAPVETPAADP